MECETTATATNHDRQSNLTMVLVQSRAKDTETRLAHALGGRVTPKHCPADVILDDLNVAIEVKTIQSSSNPSHASIIQMSPLAKRRKRAYSSKKGLRLLTVAVDLRVEPHRFYVREGVGTFLLRNMQSADSLKTVKSLIKGSVRSGAEVLPERIRKRRASKGRSFQVHLARFPDVPPHLRYRILVTTFDYAIQSYFTPPRSGKWCWELLINQLGFPEEQIRELKFREQPDFQNTCANVGFCNIKSAQLRAGQFLRDPLCR
jgi:hypothetical protein